MTPGVRILVGTGGSNPYWVSGEIFVGTGGSNPFGSRTPSKDGR